MMFMLTIHKILVIVVYLPIKDIIKYSNVIENRIEEELDIKSLIEDNNKNLELVIKHHLNYILIKDEYNIDIDNLFK